MADSEDYTLVWIGTKRQLRLIEETEEVQKGTHPLARKATEAGLEIFVDTFEGDLAGKDIYTLLIGKRLTLLGYKEGISSFEIGFSHLKDTLAETKAKFQDAGILDEPVLQILVHIEY